MIVIFIFFYIVVVALEHSRSKNRHFMLLVACVVLAFCAGFRDVMRWADTIVYVISFNDYTHGLYEWSDKDVPFGYAEYGFYFLGVIFKTFSSNSTLYLLFIAVLSFIFLYKDFRRYCVYPLFGLCAYIARFYLTRNLMQIRAGLSYALILWGVQYITKRDWKHYFFWVFVAYLFHRSAIIAVPLYFLCILKPNKLLIVIGILIAFLIGGPGKGMVMSFVGDNAQDLTVTTYATKDYQSELGLMNPMIYFQLFFLWIYTMWEDKFKVLTADYYTIRTAYWYSTFILIALSAYTALSGRTSSMFSTLEMAIIPMIVNTFSKNNRILAYICLGVGLSIIFYMNIPR